MNSFDYARWDQILAYIFCGLFDVMVVLRFICYDKYKYLIWFNMYTKYVFLPVYIPLIAGLAYMNYYLIIVAGLPVAYHVYWMAMDYIPFWSASKDDNLPNDVYRIFVNNLLMVNHSVTGIMDEIVSFEPDVIMLQEYSSRWDKAFTRTYALCNTYTHYVKIVREDSFGTNYIPKIYA
ncbi:hypothetical protein RFI_08683 [Reticulomyxa filosa]|uniref:Endonuclease/exonuclease/phosphatase domain-containing protein n=1 Tax=Reticulomyxa filosa TaxID=46433 RepID=X6NRB1_RETFI|nr:hypothetical protein RFI_08683 [Reticulomyxa filosa]|eukprot:ETO28448.1 hypothetical protein RFI_08683 [Reticulomyxa filosa]